MNAYKWRSGGFLALLRAHLSFPLFSLSFSAGDRACLKRLFSPLLLPFLVASWIAFRGTVDISIVYFMVFVKAWSLHPLFESSSGAWALLGSHAWGLWELKVIACVTRNHWEAVKMKKRAKWMLITEVSVALEWIITAHFKGKQGCVLESKFHSKMMISRPAEICMYGVYALLLCSSSVIFWKIFF